ncbi:YqgE/AlgH family protein [Parenemella sanctibonifatiensis]|uniref:YqgE/AlgH family protein n=1 Tax=Parenemella sanctibonifatiensis TaxID=2016505 RepID=UPI002694345F|nr:YqgE/AlgH family protein [Parenemella sanctibonifatiensis]
MLSSTPVLPGRLLVATTELSSGYFKRSVVLMLDHDDSGSLGVVINRISALPLQTVLPDWAATVGPPGFMFDGGPVSTTGAICLARLTGEDEPPGWRRVYGEMGLLHLDTPVELVDGAFGRLRVFAGYAGWGAGQLEDELAADKWAVVSGTSQDPFTDDPDGLWRAVLRRQRNVLAMMATWTEDPDQN